MALKTSITQNIVLNDKLTFDVLSSNYHHIHNFNSYRDHEKVHNFENYEEDITLPQLEIINERTIGAHLQNAQILKVPFTFLPSQPNEMVNCNNNNLLNNMEIRDGGTCGRVMSPKGNDSDESGLSFYSSKGDYRNKNGSINKNGVSHQHKTKKNQNEHSAPFNKCNISPNVYYPSYFNQSNGTFRNTRTFSNYSNRSRHTGNSHNKNHVTTDNITRRVHGLMERFKSRSFLMKIDPHPEFLLNGGPWDHLNQAIWDVFSAKAQKENTYVSKLESWKAIFLSIKKYLNSYGLFIVGSTMSGFGLESSDIDMCLLTKSFVNDPRIDALHHLDHVRNLLLKNGVADDAELIVAKVPILKFRDPETGFEIDLNCNNGVGIRNTHLLHCYARLDWRVRPLVIIVKLWAQANNINDAKNMTISSYSLALMVINYLQCGVTPPVLPCLHTLAPEVFNSSLESTNTDVQEDIEVIKNYKSDNNNTLGDLLIAFLNYYSYFNFTEFAISARTGSRLPIDECRYMKAPKNDVNQWKFLCIEEPFNFSNTARSVFDVEKFKFIKEVFMRSYRELSANKILSTILPVQFGNIVPPPPLVATPIAAPATNQR